MTPGSSQTAFSRFPALGLAVALACSAFGTVGPTDAANWRQLVARACPNEDGPLVFTSAGDWFPDTQGFVDAFGAPTLSRQGVLTVTQESLVFLQWSPREETYFIIYRATNDQIASVRIETFGSKRRMVVAGRDYRMQSFSIARQLGSAVDVGGIDTALEILQKRLSNRELHPPVPN